jgi:hypothetical protein
MLIHHPVFRRIYSHELIELKFSFQLIISIYGTEIFVVANVGLIAVYIVCPVV